MGTDLEALFKVAGAIIGSAVAIPTFKLIWSAASESGARGESIKNNVVKLDIIGTQLSTHVDEVRSSFEEIHDAAEKTRAEFVDIKRSLHQQSKDQAGLLAEWTSWRKQIDGHVIRIDLRVEDIDRRVGPGNRRVSGRKGGERSVDPKE